MEYQVSYQFSANGSSTEVYAGRNNRVTFTLPAGDKGKLPPVKSFIDERHEKTDLKVFVVVMLKEGWVRVAVPILLLA